MYASVRSSRFDILVFLIKLFFVLDNWAEDLSDVETIRSFMAD